MDKQTQRIVSQGIFAALAVSAAGMLLGLRRLIWGFWIVASVIWIALILHYVPGVADRDWLYYLLALGPPALVYVVLKVISAFVEAVTTVIQPAAETIGASGLTTPECDGLTQQRK